MMNMPNEQRPCAVAWGLVLSLFVTLMTCPCNLTRAFAAEGPWGAIVVGEQTEAERLATIDLQRYLAQVTGQVPVVMTSGDWESKPVSAVVLGTPQSNGLFASLKPNLSAAGDEGFCLDEQFVTRDQLNSKPCQLVCVAGATPEGAVNAIYGLLRELGFGFYLGSETIPAALPAGLPNKPITRQPAQKIRGVLPWYNFFDSPTTWDPIDHRAFADQLIRLGANFVGFHTYDSEPFAAYEENGKMKWGARLLNTATPTWGTASLATRDFFYDTDKLFAQDYFGAASTFAALNDPDAAIHLEQDIMRDALDYAKKRGLHTCLGFELNDDPTRPEVRDYFLKRLNRVLDQYPALDYLWLWESETQGAQGFPVQYNLQVFPYKLDPASMLVNYGFARREVFKRVVDEAHGEPPFFQDTEMGKRARAIEGARLEQFAQLALHALAHRAKAPRLVLSGWGGDERIISAEYYDGLDKLLPKDVVFSSLEHISPRPRVDKVYNVLPADRERWPIPWLECDGDQWQAQPAVHPFASLMRDLQAGGSQGVLGIHWRTRGVEENFSFLVDAAWRPGLTADQFYADYARTRYGAALADKMTSIHSRLDALGYRWALGGGQGECAPFTWGQPDPAQFKPVEDLRAEAAALLTSVDLTPAGRQQLEWLVGRMDWSLSYARAELAVARAQDLLKQAAAKAPEHPKEARTLARQALAAMDRDSLAAALRAYARTVTTRGEYGVLATINTKAGVAWRDLRQQAAHYLGGELPVEAVPAWQTDSTTQPAVLLPRFVTSAAEGTDLELEPIVLGGQPATLHYRPLNGPARGSKLYALVRLSPVAGWVQRGVIPAAVMQQPGLEVYISLGDAPAKPAWGPVVITVMPKLDVQTAPSARGKADVNGQLVVEAREGKATPVVLSWNDVPAADYFRVLRDGQPVVETAVPFCPDNPPQGKGQYVVEAIRDGQVILRSAAVDCAAPDRPFTETVMLVQHANQGGVNLSWPAAQSGWTARYIVQLAAAAGGPVEPQTLGQVPASRMSGHAFHHNPGPGDWVYRVAPVSAAGREGMATTVSLHFPPAPVTKAVLDLPLTARPEQVSVSGNVTFDRDGADVNRGYLELSHQDWMNLGSGLTLDFEFKADSIDATPVLLSHGVWQGDGWFVQILGGKLIVRTPNRDAEGPAIVPGQWYQVRFVYDGEKLRLAVNGQWLTQPDGAAVHPVDAARGFVLGQYESKTADFQFHGRLRNVRIYPDMLLDLGAGSAK